MASRASSSPGMITYSRHNMKRSGCFKQHCCFCPLPPHGLQDKNWFQAMDSVLRQIDIPHRVVGHAASLSYLAQVNKREEVHLTKSVTSLSSWKSVELALFHCACSTHTHQPGASALSALALLGQRTGVTSSSDGDGTFTKTSCLCDKCTFKTSNTKQCQCI